MPSELDDGNLLELTGKFISRLADDFRDLSDKKCYDIVTAQFNRDHVVQIPHGNDQDCCIIAYRGNVGVFSLSSERDLFWTKDDIKSKRHLDRLKEGK